MSDDNLSYVWDITRDKHGRELLSAWLITWYSSSLLVLLSALTRQVKIKGPGLKTWTLTAPALIFIYSRTSSFPPLYSSCLVWRHSSPVIGGLLTTLQTPKNCAKKDFMSICRKNESMPSYNVTFTLHSCLALHPPSPPPLGISFCFISCQLLAHPWHSQILANLLTHLLLLGLLISKRMASWEEARPYILWISVRRWEAIADRDRRSKKQGGWHLPRRSWGVSCTPFWTRNVVELVNTTLRLLDIYISSYDIFLLILFQISFEGVGVGGSGHTMFYKALFFFFFFWQNSVLAAMEISQHNDVA